MPEVELSPDVPEPNGRAGPWFHIAATNVTTVAPFQHNERTMNCRLDRFLRIDALR
jgi:hypothetical protein